MASKKEDGVEEVLQEFDKFISKKKNQLKRHNENIGDLKRMLDREINMFNQFINNSFDELKEYQDKLNNVEQEYEAYERGVESFKREYETGSVEEGAASDKFTKISPRRVTNYTVENEEAPSEELYFTVPDKRGKFSEDNSKSSEDENCYYRIQYKGGDNRGRLFYNSSERDGQAIDARDMYLKPACDIENPKCENPTGVNVIEPGLVIKEENHWVIKDKVKVEFK